MNGVCSPAATAPCVVNKVLLFKHVRSCLFSFPRYIAIESPGLVLGKSPISKKRRRRKKETPPPDVGSDAGRVIHWGGGGGVLLFNGQPFMDGGSTGDNRLLPRQDVHISQG